MRTVYSYREYQRQQLAKKIVHLLEKSEERSNQHWSTNSVPFSWLEKTIAWGLLKLEQRVERLVVRFVEPVLAKIGHRWRQFRHH